MLNQNHFERISLKTKIFHSETKLMLKVTITGDISERILEGELVFHFFNMVIKTYVNQI